MGFAPPLLAVEDGCGILEKVLPTTEYASLPRPSCVSLDKESCKKRRLERMEVMKQKRRKLASSCGDSISTVSCSSADSISPIFLTKDEIRRKKNRESAERSRLRKLRLIDNLSAQVTALTEKRANLKLENAQLRAPVAPAVPSSGASKRKATACSLEAPPLKTKADFFLDDDRSDTSTLSSSSNSPYHAATFPACSLSLPPRFLPSTAYRIGCTSSVPSSDDQMLSFYTSEESVASPISTATAECCDDTFFEFNDLCDFDFSALEHGFP